MITSVGVLVTEKWWLSLVTKNFNSAWKVSTNDQFIGYFVNYYHMNYLEHIAILIVTVFFGNAYRNGGVSGCDL